MKIKEKVAYRCVLCKIGEIIHTQNVEIEKEGDYHRFWGSGWIFRIIPRDEKVFGGRLLKKRPSEKWPSDRWREKLGWAWTSLTVEELENRFKRFLALDNAENRENPPGGICKKCLKKKEVKTLVDSGFLEVK
ncbi:MAG: hypothetical protein HYY55_01935 [Candidatus Niyogibacteria bacterium]|nr:MAG: hypothetical protein HYY55_01935 [Candidatus Niyogibacteria bacterium]